MTEILKTNSHIYVQVVFDKWAEVKPWRVRIVPLMYGADKIMSTCAEV